MENERETQYDFCPQCGAMTKDGVCTGCGYGKPEEKVWPVEQVQGEEAVETPEPMVQPEPEVQPEPVVQPEPEVQPEPMVQSESEVQPEPVVQSEPAQGGYYGSPYSEYSNQIPYSNGAIPPDVPEKKNNGKTAAIVCVCIGVFVILLCLIGYCIFSIVKKVNEQGERKAEEYLEEDFWDDKFDEASELPESDSNDKNYEPYDYSDFYKDAEKRHKKNGNDDGEQKPDSGNSGEKTYGHSPEDDYYEDLDNCFRDDLSYSVEIESAVYAQKNQNVYIGCSYPVLSGDIPNVEYLNQAIYEEYRYFVDFYEEKVKKDMAEDDFFSCSLTGFVTYMDEEYLSIVFAEDADWNDEYFLLTLYCINIDVEQGVVLDNTELLEVNDAFSVEFRIREGEQNQSDTLDVYTDQELTEMLSDSLDLIVFYTPLGMEVGVNHDTGWATATYKDYQKYLKHF